jgi:hypothetical protein
MKDRHKNQTGLFDNAIDLVANKVSIHATATDQQLIHNLGTTSAANADHWSAPNFDRRQAAHSLFQYPGRMVPEVQQNLIQAVKTVRPTAKSVLDPYMGSATALVASMYHGFDCYGQDINPLAILIGHVKTTSFDSVSFNTSLVRTVEYAREDTSLEITVDFKDRQKWFRDDVSLELSKLRRSIMRQEDLVNRRILWLTLAETIRLTSNDRTSTYKLHARPVAESAIRQLDVIKTFHDLGVRNLRDLLDFRGELREAGYIRDHTYTERVVVGYVDSTRQLLAPADGTKFDLLVTSPPYGDNRTTIPYGEHAYLPLQWINLEDIDPLVAAESAEWLNSTGGLDRKSMGGMSTERDSKVIEKLQDASATLREHLGALANADSVLRRKVTAFYDDFYQSLELIANSLKPDAYLIWTLGNRRVNKMEIRNDAILREFLGTLGCEYVTELERIIHSKRMPKSNRSGKTMANEQILILRKNGG